MNTILNDEEFALDIWGGKSFELTVEYFDEDENGVQTPIELDADTDTIVGQVRPYPGGELLAEFATEIVDGENGIFEVRLTPEQTAKVIKNSVFEIAIEIDNGGEVPDVEGLMSGPVNFKRGVIE